MATALFQVRGCGWYDFSTIFVELKATDLDADGYVRVNAHGHGSLAEYAGGADVLMISSCEFVVVVPLRAIFARFPVGCGASSYLAQHAPRKTKTEFLHIFADYVVPKHKLQAHFRKLFKEKQGHPDPSLDDVPRHPMVLRKRVARD